MNIKLSVCLTTYNRANLLDMTLASLAAQTRLPDELIISDDCSSDNTSQIVDNWKACFPLVRYNRNDRNLNMPGNLNAALSLATGEYIANLHDADEFDSTLLSKWENLLDCFPSAGFVFCGIGGWHRSTKYGNGIILHEVQPITPGRQFFELFFLHKFSSIVWGTVMARKSAYADLLPFDSAFGFVSDVDMWMRMCARYDVAYVREPLIILDHSPTKERKTNYFNWTWLNHSRKMQYINIKRFYKDDSERLRRELQRHNILSQIIYFRFIMTRLLRRDWHGALEGMRLCRELNLPLRLLGAWSSDKA